MMISCCESCVCWKRLVQLKFHTLRCKYIHQLRWLPNGCRVKLDQSSLFLVKQAISSVLLGSVVAEMITAPRTAEKSCFRQLVQNDLQAAVGGSASSENLQETVNIWIKNSRVNLPSILRANWPQQKTSNIFFEDIAGDSSLINFIRQRVNIVARWGPRVVFIGLNSPHEYYRYIYISIMFYLTHTIEFTIEFT